MTVDGVTHHQVVIRTTGTPDGSLSMHVATAGPEGGAPVVLLHGFPECWYGWRKQIPALAAAGYRVIVPDQRGYARTDRPPGDAAYGLGHIVADVDGLLDHLGVRGPIHLAGHDWGGGAAWAWATARSDRLRTLSVFNCPHPAVLRRALPRDPRQLARSWYMAAFQVPWLPERVMTAASLRRELLRSSAPGTFTDDDLDLYAREVWASPEHLRGPIGWYRGNRGGTFPRGRITAPVQLVWGTADHALGFGLAAPSLERLADSRLVPVPGCSHWVLAERPDAANAALLEWLGAFGGADPWVYKLVHADVWRAAPDVWPGSPDDLRD
ncbi:MAG TPA: alpha/beta fold hydrolase, partial [Myxococcota bacterium]|nr:alpha/beta fold hydrolase [Myxococcota bacterium]